MVSLFRILNFYFSHIIFVILIMGESKTMISYITAVFHCSGYSGPVG